MESIEAPSTSLENTSTQNESVNSLLGKLTPKLREVVALYSVDEMEVKDIAKALNIAEGTVKSRLHSAREVLKTSLERGKKNE